MPNSPPTKRIRRADLHRSSSPSSSSASTSTSPRAPPETTNPTSTPFISSPQPPNNEDETYAFKLFAPRDPTTSIAQISLDPPAPTDAGPQRRPSSHYLATFSPALLAQFSTVSVTGAEVLARSKTPWPGCRCAWRVYSATLTPSSQSTEPVEKEKSNKRPRKGKKARIKLRTRIRAEESRVRAAAEAKEAKEQHVRAKKTAMNRRKQLKRRERAREAKGKDAGGKRLEEGEGEGEEGGGGGE